MDILQIIQRIPNPRPWSEGEKIPWNEPGFSRRMLREHLSQEHDAASRRFETNRPSRGMDPEGVGSLGHPSRVGLRLVACSMAGEPQTGYPVPYIHFARR